MDAPHLNRDGLKRKFECDASELKLAKRPHLADSGTAVDFHQMELNRHHFDEAAATASLHREFIELANATFDQSFIQTTADHHHHLVVTQQSQPQSYLQHHTTVATTTAMDHHLHHQSTNHHHQPDHQHQTGIWTSAGGGATGAQNGDMANYNSVNSAASQQQTNGNHSNLPNSNDTAEDVEDRNLSWLLNFKLDEQIPHLSPEAKHKTLNGTDGSQNEKTCIEEDDTNVAENVVIENTSRTPKKPPFTYTELIEYALEDQGELTVSGIYQWISDRFKYYKSNDDRWKNSVRHNLSINPHFRKGSKASQGAGHLWTISSRDSEVNILAWEHKKQRLELFFKMEESAAKRDTESSMQDELAAATASILPPNHQTESAQIMQDTGPPISHQIETYNTTAHMEFENGHNDLRRSAGEILNGVKRNVEVQIMQPLDSNQYHSYTILDSDYLNPISKEEIVQECGLRATRRHDIANEYYVTTTIDPIELGINMSANEEILFEDDFNFSYFGSNIMGAHSSNQISPVCPNTCQ